MPRCTTEQMHIHECIASIYHDVQGLRRPGKDILQLRSGGSLIAECLKKHGVKHMFVLSGGHVAPVYCCAEEQGIQVIDVRHEVNNKCLSQYFRDVGSHHHANQLGTDVTAFFFYDKKTQDFKSYGTLASCT